MGLRFDVVTLFPEMVEQTASCGVTGKAIERNLVALNTWNPRDYVFDNHKTVDDRPYGGGPGMVMKVEPLNHAVEDARASNGAGGISKVVYLSPQGRPITQTLLRETLQLSQLILVAGRYEGVDERFVHQVCDEEWSLGDFVLSGGELAALVVVDAVTRLVPGVLGDSESAEQDSFMQGLLDCPHFTRPEKSEWGHVPDVLLSGNHAEISKWRRQQALYRTWQRRPDLLSKIDLTADQRACLKKFTNEFDIESEDHE